MCQVQKSSSFTHVSTPCHIIPCNVYHVLSILSRQYNSKCRCICSSWHLYRFNRLWAQVVIYLISSFVLLARYSIKRAMSLVVSVLGTWKQRDGTTLTKATVFWLILLGVLVIDRRQPVKSSSKMEKFTMDPLSKENFDTWTMQMEAVLTETDSLQFVDGTYEKPKVVQCNALNWLSALTA